MEIFEYLCIEEYQHLHIYICLHSMKSKYFDHLRIFWIIRGPRK